jgi:hypothetical protein
VVEAEWSIYANHGGGYSYRLCKKVEGQPMTEECYQQGHLDFATDTTEIRYTDSSVKPFLINATTTSEGTYPLKSQWRKNPIPMCNCDVGYACSAKPSKEFISTELAVEGGGKQCSAISKDKCPTSGYDACLKCGDNSTYDCEQCCPGFELITKGKYSFCKQQAEPSCTKDNPDHSCMFVPYPKSYKPAGHETPLCPSGLQFPPAWPEGYSSAPTQNMDFTMVDKLRVPQLDAGEYSLSWRWDCEETPQVWNSCADLSITA